ncbi:Zn2/Cys6 DNA-binding protein [Glarea lozoyensis ATCC 20868]|uniref:Zn2/Cys6 DNA-binding protein n=1 Tax=Glarea lozoyensis (strain ATCC 20868 / MF5171) TaxID=1116229 RepID=S3D4W8_GLAL2|nr:Zn2/Cys6 DNA-binding protein [Glarea lozoyensis ATCC 20868]EPE32810.1 Zn2/Cys6 DNA-binding protein [Glarea lozoyensis ATCC 20868]
MEYLQKLKPKSISRTKPRVTSKTSLKRTFTGCWTCRSRRVKCDERIPSCTPCEKFGQACAGYAQSLVWVTPNHKTYQHVSTWKGFVIHDASSVDELIERCDIVKDEIDNGRVSCLPFSVFQNSQCHLAEVEEAEALTECDNLSSPGNASAVEDSPVFTPSDLFTSSLQLLMPTADSRLTPAEANLFHHYVSRVAPMLLPLDDTGNPWATYPAMALHYSSVGQRYLLYALLAHAAILRANIGSDTENMLATGGKYYVLAMEELRKSLGEDKVDYLFRGSSKTWRHHYNAAWEFLQQQGKQKKWTRSEDAWYATQSFYLLRIMSETSLVRGERFHAHQIRVDSEDDIPLKEFSTNTHFGYTIGASNTLMSCISEINEYSQQGLIFGVDEATDEIVGNLRKQLEAFRTTTAVIQGLRVRSPNDACEGLCRHSAKQAHLRAYTAAALVYFHHEFYALPPMAMAPYVSEILNSISTFTELTKGNYTLWPIFIAAVEAYEEVDIRRFQELFRNACAVGMANRVQIQKLVERIWKIREAQASQTGQEKGLIRVDWKNVMHVLEMDVLLI